MQIFEIETGIPVPKRRRKPACPYPPARLHLVLIACTYLLLTVLGSSFVWRALS